VLTTHFPIGFARRRLCEKKSLANGGIDGSLCEAMIRNEPRLEKQRHQTGTFTPQVSDLLTAGLAHHRAGNLQLARDTYRVVLTIDPRQADALHLLGVSYLNEHPSEAESLIRRAISSDKRNPLYYSNLAVALRNQQRFEEALALYDKALRRKPDYLEAHVNRGLTLLALRRSLDAVAAFGAALMLQSDFPAALKFRGDALYDLRRWDEAAADYDRLLAITPGDAGALNNRGLALLELKRFDEALESFDLALVFVPDRPEIVNGRGCVLKAMGRLDEALECFTRAASSKPDYVEAVVNQGSAQQELARFGEALASYTKAQQIRPDYAPAHWNEATVRLLTGDLACGFAKAEWRQKVAALGIAASTFAQPFWLGETPLDGKTIVVHADLGFGDTIHFARYIPLLAARGARVVTRVQQALRTLIGGISGVALCIGKDDRLPDFDVHCPLSSLPLAFGTTLESIPASTPYLSAPELSPVWHDRLGAADKPKIGLVWSGNASHLNDRNRSIAAHLLRPLLDCDAMFFGLQTEIRAEDEPALRGKDNLVMAGQFFSDFSETAAVVAALDLVIAVDTSVAHLTGALGRPVWILLPFVPDWRWLIDREDSPWYPTARLFRQGADRRWEPVLDRAKHALSTLGSRGT
jgi:tetratricopeptide (TPR) repeat protein